MAMLCKAWALVILTAAWTGQCDECRSQNITSTSMRLGFVLEDVPDIRTIDAAGAAKIVDAVKRYGVLVIENQPLSRAEQVEFSAKLGEVVILPPSFEGLDPEPGQPAIQRVTNYWSNGTWKGQKHSFGGYWHQDGQFWARSHRWIFSMLVCAASPPVGGETGFADLRNSFATLDQESKHVASSAQITASVRNIRDFTRNGVQAELDLFDDVDHPMIDTFPGAETSDIDDDNVILYVGSPTMRLKGVDNDTLIPNIIDHATHFAYYHKWKPGDIVIWDNVQTLHSARPYNNTEGIRRELYRTQFRLKPTQAHLDRMPQAQNRRPRWLNEDGSVKWLNKHGQLQSVA